MITNKSLRRISLLGLAIILFLAGLIFITDTALALDDEPGDNCVQDFRAGARCTANDVRIEEVSMIGPPIQGCDAEPLAELTANFAILVSADGSPDRYDIGLFIASDGGSALVGNSCYHDYLEPELFTVITYGDYNGDTISDIVRDYTTTDPDPLTIPFWDGDGDSCGDMESNTQVIFIRELTIACEDGDEDGAADMHVCSSWDNNTNTTCSGVAEAFPGTNSKCGCGYVNFDFTPTNVVLSDFTARNEVLASPLSISLMALVVLGALFYAWRRNTRGRQDIQSK